MVIEALVARYPKLYHMADKRNWANICKYGLLSTTALLDLFEYQGKKRFEIESQLRIKEFRVSHPDHGEAFIRDQDPMRDRPQDGIYLEKCLVDITSQEWFEHLNRKTFFWADTKGLNFMLGARLYRSRSHYVITVDTQKLLSSHADKVTLSPINSGSLYGMKKRSTDTFKPIARHSEPWVTELAVEYSIPDIIDLTISVEECICRWDGGQKICKEVRQIWPT